jgi:hypothetical protein
MEDYAICICRPNENCGRGVDCVTKWKVRATRPEWAGKAPTLIRSALVGCKSFREGCPCLVPGLLCEAIG